MTKDIGRSMTTRDPKRLEEQLCELLPIYKTIGLKVQAVGDLLKTRVPYIPGNTNHLGTMHAGVIWMAGEVLGGLAYFGEQDRNQVLEGSVDVQDEDEKMSQISVSTSVRNRRAPAGPAIPQRSPSVSESSVSGSSASPEPAPPAPAAPLAVVEVAGAGWDSRALAMWIRPRGA